MKTLNKFEIEAVAGGIDNTANQTTDQLYVDDAGVASNDPALRWGNVGCGGDVGHLTRRG